MQDTPSTPQDAAASPDAPGANPEPTVMPSLEELLKAAELKAAEHHDAAVRR